MNHEFDVRIPELLLEQLQRGEITVSMYVTMSLLYKWANWKTGRVQRVCASNLVHATQGAYSDRTYQEAMRRLEEMGWITRHMTPGSRKWYPVTIHNYKWADDAGKIHILNPKELKTNSHFSEDLCGEASTETSSEASGETSTETSTETSDTNLSLLLSEHESQHQSEHEKERVSKPASERAAGSDGGEFVHSDRDREDSRETIPDSREIHVPADQKDLDAKVPPAAPQEETLEERKAALDSLTKEDCRLFLFLYPTQAPHPVAEEAAICKRVVSALSDLKINPVSFMVWQRTHKPPKLQFRSFAQMRKAFNSERGTVLFNDYTRCFESPCKTCKAAGIKLSSSDDDSVPVAKAFAVDE